MKPPPDTDSLRALQLAAEAMMHLVALRGVIPGATSEALEDTVAELKWMVESRARWMHAASVQQISIHEEEVPE